jgi:serine/threonine-protein kinase
MEVRMLLRRCVSVALVGIALSLVQAAYAADPTKEECIASSERGQELRNATKLNDARAQFSICVAASCPGPIREDCAERLDEIATAMPSIIFQVKDAAGNEAAGVQITADGQPVARGAIDLDPGEHTFAFEATGLKKFEKRLVLAEGVKQRRDVVIMARAEAAPIASTPSPPTGEAPTRWARPPTLAWVAFGVGGAGLVFGVTAGLVAGGKHSTLAGECDNGAGTCAPQYAGNLDSFHTWRTVSTVGYVVGALGVAGGAVLWFTAPSASSTMTAHVWLGPASAGIAGRF